MKMKRTILPLGALALFGVSAGLMVRTVINPNNIKEVRATPDPDIISTNEEFADFIAKVNKGERYDNQLVQLNDNVSYVIKVKPSASSTATSIFGGVFDGRNHTITITVNFSDTTPSLFRYLGGNSDFKNAVFKNTNLNYSVTSGKTSGDVYVAPIATYNNGRIQNVHSTIDYNKPDVNYVGGLVEKNQATGIIEDCSVAGSISAKGYVAGIACENSGTVRNCENNCAITSVADKYAGGIVAINGSSSFGKARIINCVNNASITSTGKDLGGIVGFMYSNSEISYCDNYGSITSTSTSTETGYGYGGLIGRMNGKDTKTGHATKVEYCYNAGNLEADRNVGGLIGLVNSGAKPAIQVTGCLTTGNVNATTGNGGTLIGWANSNTISLDDTYAAGAKAGVAELGVGAGTAASTDNSVNGVSDKFKQVIQKIREYHCEEIPGFEKLYNGLSDGENKLLNQLNYYYDYLNPDAMKTYGQAAQYIIGRDQTHIAMFSLLNMNGLDNNGTAIVVIISALGLSSVLLFLAIRGKRNAANE